MKKPSLYLAIAFLSLPGVSLPQDISWVVDGSIQKQSIDGIGVNVNTRSWNGEELEPALHLLLDSMKASLWRVVVETVEKWEDVNDNSDPQLFNWQYYDSLYETPKFRKVWGLMSWLNRHGITKNLMINFMGYIPAWMGEETIKPEMEDEYVEMLVSFFYYAKNKKHLEFGLVSPTNESDWRKEGPKLNPQQYASVMKKLMERMSREGMGDVLYVGPDTADMNKAIGDYIPELMQDAAIMAKMAHFGVHSYGGYYAPIDSALKHSSYPSADFWVTEWNKWKDGLDEGVQGIYTYDFAAECVNQLLDLLQHGARGLMVWEGYDSYYEHHAPSPFSYWGILAYDHLKKTYSARKHLYAISQVSAFVAPGFRQTGQPLNRKGIRVLTFCDSSSRKITVTGINRRKTHFILTTSFINLPREGSFEMYYTNSKTNRKRGSDLILRNGKLKATIPPDCIFTIVSKE